MLNHMEVRVRSLCVLTSVLLVFAFCLPRCWAQFDEGSVTGIVRDSQGAVVVGAQLTLENLDTNFALKRTTGSSGSYSFTPIKIGSYRLTASATGFASTVIENVRVDVSQVVGLNLTLKPGGVSETVTVTAEAELQTEEASTGQVFSAKVIDAIPLDQSNYVFAAQLSTGVAPPNQGFRQVAGAGDFSSNVNRVSQTTSSWMA